MGNPTAPSTVERCENRQLRKQDILVLVLFYKNNILLFSSIRYIIFKASLPLFLNRLISQDVIPLVKVDHAFFPVFGVLSLILEKMP